MIMPFITAYNEQMIIWHISFHKVIQEAIWSFWHINDIAETNVSTYETSFQQTIFNLHNNNLKELTRLVKLNMV
jgi:hypothetical protein